MSQIPIPLTTLTPQERLVWNILRHRRGRARAIKKKSLVRLAGLHERTVRDAVKSLIEKHHCRIGSTPNPPAGYFIIETAAEAEECCKRHHGQALSILAREMSLRKISRRDISRQIEIELAEWSQSDQA